jgi:hypothetical protein
MKVLLIAIFIFFAVVVVYGLWRYFRHTVSEDE